MNHRAVVVLFLVSIILGFLFPLALASTISIDKTGTVSSVIDGSSFTLTSGETVVKLAGIETPVAGAVGYEESRGYLSGMIQGKTVYLDIDSVTVNDQQGRLLCVAYLDYNSTHFENINQAMVQNGYAVSGSLANTDFSSLGWTWFVPKETPTASPIAIATAGPTASPTPTPFSAPTPSISPDVSQPTATENFTPVPGSFAVITTWTILVILATATLLIVALIIALLYKRKKNKNRV